LQVLANQQCTQTFKEYVALARKYMGNDIKLILATNGVNMTDEMAKELQRYNVHVWVSLHRPEKAGLAVEMLKKYGVLHGVSADPSIAAIDWAGQVDWFVTAPEMNCQWLPNGRVMIMANGKITTCCLDSDGSGVVGNVNDGVDNLNVQPYSLCNTCNQKLDVELLNVS